MADLILRRPSPRALLLLSHIREAISIAAGETDHVLTRAPRKTPPPGPGKSLSWAKSPGPRSWPTAKKITCGCSRRFCPRPHMAPRRGGRLDQAFGLLGGGVGPRGHPRDDLLDEVDPTTTLEMLTDFERVCGLPANALTARKAWSKGGARSWPSSPAGAGKRRPILSSLPRAWAMKTEIEEFRPFRVGSRPESGPTARHGPMPADERAACHHQPFHGGQLAGERLASWGNEKLECYIADKSPAHTELLFGYYTALATEDDSVLTTEDGFVLEVDSGEV